MSGEITSTRLAGSRWNIIVSLGALLALAAFLVPAINNSRAQARVNGCLNNMRLIGLGLNSYVDTNETFPSGTVLNESLAASSRLSWYVEAWPFVGDGQVELLLDRLAAWNDECNVRPMVRIPLDDDQVVECRRTGLSCPEIEDDQTPYGNLTITSYVGSTGVGEETAAALTHTPRTGIWGYSRSTHVDDVCDGLSKTLLLLETAMQNGPWTAGGPSTLRHVDKTQKAQFGVGRSFGGLHPSVTIAAFADSSVRPLDDDIDERVLKSLVTACASDNEAAKTDM